MTQHRFRVGQTVRVAGDGANKPATAAITRLLPADHEHLPLRYRVKVAIDKYERMVTEDQLTPG
ncbi:hypothetical protein [Methylopila sp. M107]|uniref:hypothetical protein n=1 Tax=Methylopila sp. M107 TaxID=1101190 RepID=UPI0012DC8039|nr:hypothetical protein [Methylopila sp. M107]